MANTPSLVSNLMVRGPFACNAVLLTHRAVGLDDMSADLVAALGKADGLMKVPYAGSVAFNLPKNELFSHRIFLDAKSSHNHSFFSLTTHRPIDISGVLRGNAAEAEEVSSDTSSTASGSTPPKKKSKKPKAKVFMIRY